MLLRVVVEVDAHVPGRGLCSLLYDDIPPVHFLRRPPCLPALWGERGDRNQNLLLASALLGLRLGLVLPQVPLNPLFEGLVGDALKGRRLL